MELRRNYLNFYFLLTQLRLQHKTEDRCYLIIWELTSFFSLLFMYLHTGVNVRKMDYNVNNFEMKIINSKILTVTCFTLHFSNPIQILFLTTKMN